MSKRKRYIYQDVLEIFENEGYEVLSTEEELLNNKGFIYATTKIKVKCSNGHIIDTITINNFKRGRRCIQCGYEKISKERSFTYEEVKAYFEYFNYQLLSETYKNNSDNLTVLCPFGHEWHVKFNNFKNQGNRCPYCCGNAKYTIEEVKEYIESFGYKLLSTEYINSLKKIEIRCPYGHEYKVTFHMFKNQSQRCPYCQVSKGEQRIMDYLNGNNINYIYEKKFDGLIGLGNGLLSYDFYLPQCNLLIEYQGGFHDGNITGNYKYTFNFERQQEHDRRKKEYAEKNNINLLEIWYWDYDNVEEILSKELKLK